MESKEDMDKILSWVLDKDLEGEFHVDICAECEDEFNGETFISFESVMQAMFIAGYRKESKSKKFRWTKKSENKFVH